VNLSWNLAIGSPRSTTICTLYLERCRHPKSKSRENSPNLMVSKICKDEQLGGCHTVSSWHRPAWCLPILGPQSCLLGALYFDWCDSGLMKDFACVLHHLEVHLHFEWNRQLLCLWHSLSNAYIGCSNYCPLGCGTWQWQILPSPLCRWNIWEDWRLWSRHIFWDQILTHQLSKVYVSIFRRRNVHLERASHSLLWGIFLCLSTVILALWWKFLLVWNWIAPWNLLNLPAKSMFTGKNHSILAELIAY